MTVAWDEWWNDDEDDPLMTTPFWKLAKYVILAAFILALFLCALTEALGA